MERELAELRRRLTEGQEEQNLEDEMKKVGPLMSLQFYTKHGGGGFNGGLF